MKLLLDTHAALWLFEDDDRLSETAKREVFGADNSVLLSAVVVWEVAIKRALGKLGAPDDFGEMFIESGCEPLPVTLAHAAAVAHLPLHHRDPFDRMLISQARAEGAALVSRDPALAPYGVPLIW